MKLTRTRKVISGIVIAGVLALAGIVGIAQQQKGQGSEMRGDGEWGRGHRGGHGMKHGMFSGRFAEKLNLTDAQKEQMTQISARFKESTKTLREQLHGARDNKRGMLNGGTFDEAAVRTAAQARANLHVEMEVARARMMSEMFAILTPEQKTQLAAEHQKMEQRRQQRGDRRGMKGGQIQ